MWIALNTCILSKCVSASLVDSVLFCKIYIQLLKLQYGAYSWLFAASCTLLPCLFELLKCANRCANINNQTEPY